MKTINIIGFGNVAQHLIKNMLLQNDIKIQNILVRQLQENNLELNNNLFVTNINDLKPADITIISVSDNAIEELSNNIPYQDQLVVHTSGTTALTLLNNKNRKGVFYPLQTFSKTKSLDFTKVPLCLEATDKQDLDTLKWLANLLSKAVYEVNSEQRKSLHVAAVFVSNFVNHMYTIGNDICKQNNVPFDVLKPLIQETADKINYLNPKDAQTGPAVRFDTKTIAKHEAFLQNNTYKTLYKLITESIQNV